VDAYLGSTGGRILAFERTLQNEPAFDYQRLDVDDVSAEQKVSNVQTVADSGSVNSAERGRDLNRVQVRVSDSYAARHLRRH